MTAAAPAALEVPGSGEARYRSVAQVLLSVVASRLVLWAVADYAYRKELPRLHPGALHEFGPRTLTALLRWDIWWYVSVADGGYRYDPHAASNIAFLPGYPAVIWLCSRLTGVSPTLAALVIANVTFVAGVVVLWSWVAERAGLAAAERATSWLLVYPFSFFFDTGYAEGIYFLFCVLSLRAAERGHQGSAAVWTTFATLTRPMGVFLVPALAWAPLLAWRTGRTPQRVAWLPVVAPLAALAVLAAYLFIAHGTPFAMLNAQRAGWGVGHEWSLFVLNTHAGLSRQMVDVFHVLVPIPLMWLSFRVFRKLGPVPGIYAVLTTALGILLGGDSVGRESLAVVPVFAVLGLSRLPPRITAIAQVCSFALLLVFTEAFVLGAFLG